MTREYKELIDALEGTGIDPDEVIEKTVQNWVEGFEAIAFLDPNANTVSYETWTSSTWLNPESGLIEIYRLNGNYLANAGYTLESWLSSEELKLYRSYCIEELDYNEDEIEIDFDLFAKIGIDWQDRLAEIILLDETC